LCRDAAKSIHSIAGDLPKEVKLVAIGSETLGQQDFAEGEFLSSPDNCYADEDQKLQQALSRPLTTFEALRKGLSFASLGKILGGSTPGNATVGKRQYFNDAVYVVSPSGVIVYRYLFPDFTTPPALTDLVQAAKKAAAVGPSVQPPLQKL